MSSKMSRMDPDLARSIINWPPGTGSVIKDYESDMDPKEIFADPQHWLEQLDKGKQANEWKNNQIR
jgi:hypothetical protein